MKVTILFFANFKELLDCGSLEYELEEGATLQKLCENLSGKGRQWRAIFGNAPTTVKASINQEMADLQTVLSAGDEVAFFPPVTGG